MENKVKKEKKGFYKKYFVVLLVLLLFLSVVYIVKAEDWEYDFSREIDIDLDGGSSENMYWETRVDRDGEGHFEHERLEDMGVGVTVLDRNLKSHTVIGYDDNEDVREGTFVEHADCVGVTPYVVIQEPTRQYYTFAGWKTQTTYDEADGIWYFECGCYANGRGDLTITALWTRIQYELSVEYDSGQCSVSGDGEYDAGSTATITVEFKEGYTLDYVEDLDNGKQYTTESEAYNWLMNDDRNIKVVAKKVKYQVAYHGNGATDSNGHDDPIIDGHEYGEEYPLRKNDYTKTGYKFDNWLEIKNNILYKDEKYVRNLTDVDGEVIHLYAQWKDITPPVITVPNSRPVEGANDYVEVDIVEGQELQQLVVNAADYESGMKSLEVKDSNGNVQSNVDCVKINVPRGTYIYYATAYDQAGNYSKLKIKVNVLSLTAVIENRRAAGSTLFARGDGGILTITVTGGIEKLVITFTDCMNIDENQNKEIELTARSQDTKKHRFKIPLYDIDDGVYTVNVKAIKGDTVLENNPEYTVRGTVLTRIKNVIKTYPVTDWSVEEE